ncbi:MAG: hypothetical protein ACRDKI_08580 [Solirubrobacterales bacterium]
MLAIAVPEARALLGNVTPAIPAHVPLMDPFAAFTKINDSLLVTLVSQFARAPGICGEVALTFDRIERSADAVALCLAKPELVSEKSRALAKAWQRSLSTNELGIVDEPRMIVARGTGSMLDAVEHSAARMIPFTSHARLASLFVQDEAGTWREHFRFALYG